MVDINNAEFSGFWRRVAAYIIDGLVLTAFFFVAFFVLSAAGIDVGPESENEGIFNLVGTIISIIYFVYFHSSERQATPGKRVMGIYVTDKDGNRITTARAIGRYFATILSAITLCIGYIMVAFTKRKTALHDMVAGTYVVKGAPF